MASPGQSVCIATLEHGVVPGTVLQSAWGFQSPKRKGGVLVGRPRAFGSARARDSDHTHVVHQIAHCPDDSPAAKSVEKPRESSVIAFNVGLR